MKLKIWMVFEAVAPHKGSLEGSLEDHVEKLESEKKVEIVEKELDEITRMENPHEKLDEGFSQVLETTLEVDGFDKAVELVINYGPTYVQMEAPDRYEMSLREGQNALQSVANTMHSYAQTGAGGMLISRATDEN